MDRVKNSKGDTNLMATADETNVKKLPSFSSVRPHEKLAIMLRADGKSYEEVTNTINAEFELAYKQATVRDWFIAGGKLEQANREYLDMLGDEAVKMAKSKVKRLSTLAADTLEELMADAFDGRVRQQAAKTVLGKYVPDRQIVQEGPAVDDLPDELSAKADDIVNGGDDGPKQVDDAPEGQADPQEPGAGGDEAVPTELLPESKTDD